MILGKMAEFFVSIFFFMPQGHPWDYTGHFFASFLGIWMLWFVFKVSRKLRQALLFAFIFISFGALAKEVEDEVLGNGGILGDMVGNVLGIVLAIFLVTLLTKLRRSARLSHL